MPLKKGGKQNRRAKQTSAAEVLFQRAPTANTKDGQMYALAEKMLGNRRLLAKCDDGKERMAIIPGKFKGRRHWINTGMLLLLNIRGYQDDKADVIYVYNADETKRLKRDGEIDNLVDKNVENACGFEFGLEENDPNVKTEDEILPKNPSPIEIESSDSSDSDQLELDDL